MTMSPALWASQSLHSWSVPDPTGYAQDIQQVDDDDQRRWYRRICPHWYAWLYRSMPSMLQRLSGPEEQALRTRFRIVYRWSVDHIGLDLMCAATAAPIPSYYWPPGHRI